MHYYVFFCEGHQEVLEKCHDLVHVHFEHDKRFTVKRELKVSWVLEFIRENKSRKDIAILFYSHKRFEYEMAILEALSKYDPNDFMLKIFFFTFDYWVYPNVKRPSIYTKMVSNVFFAKNHYVFTFCKSLDDLNAAHNFDYGPYADKIFFDTNLWCCYASSHVPFNENPIPKVFLSGALNETHYPERNRLRIKSKTDKSIVCAFKSKQKRYNHKSYGHQLSQHLCCFASSIHVFHKSTKKFINTHLILQKVFEILSSGSLLLCPKAEEPHLNKIGLFDNVNMKVSRMRDFDATKRYILNPENRKVVDRMRRAGQELAKTMFTSTNKFHEIMEKINSVPKESMSLAHPIHFKKHKDLRGCLIPIESYKDIPFNIDRVFFVKDVDDLPRGFHAHKKVREIIFPIAGCFDVELTDGTQTKSFHLDSDHEGLIIYPCIWLKMYNFSPDCIIVGICDYPYDESESIRNYDDFLKFVQEKEPEPIVKYFDLEEQTCSIRTEIDLKIREIIDSSRFVLGPELDSFESAFAEFNEVKHCVGVSNGTSALIVALKSLRLHPGDKIAVQANAYIAAPLAIEQCGLKTVTIDVDENLNLDLKALDHALEDDIKAVIVVHLYGMSPDMNHLMSLKEKHGFYLIEDAAQAHGSMFNGKKLGSFGEVGCFSFYPGKNLGSFGEGGCIITNNDDYACYARRYRNYGSVEKYHWEIKGSNERLHNIQAAILEIKLKYLHQWNQRRNDVARIYDENLASVKEIVVPKNHPLLYRNYHLYVVMVLERENLKKYLMEKGIPCSIHYPETFYKSPAFSELNHLEFKADTYKNRLLSLPMYPEMPLEHAKIVCKHIRNFYLTS